MWETWCIIQSLSVFFFFFGVKRKELNGYQCLLVVRYFAPLVWSNFDPQSTQLGRSIFIPWPTAVEDTKTGRCTGISPEFGFCETVVRFYDYFFFIKTLFASFVTYVPVKCRDICRLPIECYCWSTNFRTKRSWYSATDCIASRAENRCSRINGARSYNTPWHAITKRTYCAKERFSGLITERSGIRFRWVSVQGRKWI